MVEQSSNIVAEIKARVDLSRFDFSRAEDRRDFDNALRAELRKIEDTSLRGHAAELLKIWRMEVFGDALRPFTDPYLRNLTERLEAVEAFLGLTPRPRQKEIKSLRPKGEKR